MVNERLRFSKRFTKNPAASFIAGALFDRA
jgi:hypothetical protein